MSVPFRRGPKRYEAICFVCGSEYMGVKKQKFCSTNCARISLRSKDKVDKMLEHQLERETSDIHVCKTFGCKTHLSLSESLASEFCLKCNYDNQLKNKQNIYQ